VSDESRRYPTRPIVGVGGVIVYPPMEAGGAHRVVLIKRRFPPLAGRWSVPGGGVDAGETLTDGLAREIREETGLVVEIGPVLDVFDRITRDGDGRVEYHYVLVDYLCTPVGGSLEAGSDVSEARVVSERDLAAYDLTEKTMDVIARALTNRQG
jgi:ADP-ribose pyrophosphatase YjhB (NUDIX family)